MLAGYRAQLFQALIAGALLPFAFAPYGQSWLAPLVLAWLFHLIWRQTPCPRRAFALGYLFGLGQFGVGVWWVYVSMHRYSGAGVAAAGGLTVLLVAFLALYPAVASAFTGWLFKRNAKGWEADPANWRPMLVLPSIWIGVEWLRGWLLTGFPWLEVGYSQIDAPLAGFAPLVGEYGTGWLTVLTAAVLWAIWRAKALPTQNRQAGHWVAVAVILWLAGAGFKAVPWTQPAGDPFRVALLQGDISQDLKWRPETRRRILAAYLDMTRRNWGADLIVWPETAVPAFYHQVREGLFLPLEREAAARGSDLLVGVPMLESATDRYYNALIGLGEASGRYYKRHLVPFGEFLPLRSLLGFILEVLQIPLSDFSAGDDDQALIVAAGFPVAATICYEDAFARDALVGLPEAAYMVNVSNDAWFGDTIAPHQHLQMARMRALEGGRYLLRATNTGITAVIDSRGKVKAQAASFVRTSLTETIVPLAGATPYVIWGDWPLWLGMLGILGWVVFDRKKGNATE
ncbi:apolipoprotein N-acyltransferase [Methylohalobius crimeensis]|uniref:apolipoprotein N-acyltransferase n=1 Tax=Methylohalobius crimeensis TaxID=244365 RepID=UPI0003B4AB01|nr:apolipoprotein N-acyltransferase [Methylohalobius crimeensis]